MSSTRTRTLSPPRAKGPEEGMQISPVELQAELDSLRSLRRRSLSRPSDALDPDLPAASRSPPLPPSPTLISPPTSPAEASDLPFARQNATDAIAASVQANASSSNADTPLSDLMWLPAHLHPDIAPQEFRAFLAEQTKPEALLRRTGSLDRKRSMLSKQYHPTERDGVDVSDDASSSSSESGAQRRRQPLERLTISDLQRLEQLAVQASAGDDQTDEGKERFKTLLRRSMSLGPEADNIPLDVDSQPIVAHAPGSLIRRTARTKIRKPSLAGDGGGHRFGPSKRGTAGRRDSEDESAVVVGEERRASITDSDELHDEPISAPITPPRSPQTSPSKLHPSKPSLSDVGPPREPPPVLVMPSPLPPGAGPRLPPARSMADAGLLLTPSPRPPRAPSPGTDERPLRPPGPAPSHSPPPPAPAPIPVGAAVESTSPTPSPTSPAPSLPPSKEKKSPWARLGLAARTSPSKQVEAEEDDVSDTSSIASTSSGASTKKGKKPKEGVFGSLFRSKAKDLEPVTPEPPVQVAISPTASGMLGPNGKYTNFYRLPIHVERAVYRLSHIKLANPRRPLYEQVLISNLMFWYLGVINKPAMAQPPPSATVHHVEDVEGRQLDPIDAYDGLSTSSASSERPAPRPTYEPEAPVPVRRAPTDSGFEVLRRAQPNGPASTPEGAWLQRNGPRPNGPTATPRTRQVSKGEASTEDVDDDDRALADALHLATRYSAGPTRETEVDVDDRMR